MNHHHDKEDFVTEPEPTNNSAEQNGILVAETGMEKEGEK